MEAKIRKLPEPNIPEHETLLQTKRDRQACFSDSVVKWKSNQNDWIRGLQSFSIDFGQTVNTRWWCYASCYCLFFLLRETDNYQTWKVSHPCIYRSNHVLVLTYVQILIENLMYRIKCYNSDIYVSIFRRVDHMTYQERWDITFSICSSKSDIVLSCLFRVSLCFDITKLFHYMYCFVESTELVCIWGIEQRQHKLSLISFYQKDVTVENMYIIFSDIYV